MKLMALTIQHNSPLHGEVLPSPKERLNTSASASPHTKPLAQTQFSGIKATPGGMLNGLDFLGMNSMRVNMSKLIYAAVIGSRMAESRSKNELWEVIRRDSLGWFFWFYGNPLMQTFLTTTLVSKNLQPLLKRGVPKPTDAKTAFMWQLNPADRYFLTTDTQLHQRLKHILKGMAEHGEDKALIEATKANFKKALQLKALISFIGLAFAMALIGVGTTWLNIMMTRANVLKKKKAPAQASAEGIGGAGASAPSALGRPTFSKDNGARWAFDPQPTMPITGVWPAWPVTQQMMVKTADPPPVFRSF